MQPESKFLTVLQQNELNLDRRPVTTVQINNGRVCNLACLHCHVEAGPKRKEAMNRETTERIVELLKQSPSVETLDITGGAPEMNPHFRWMVEEASKLGLHIIDRCNLTILEEPGYEDLAHFLKEHRVEVVASLPCYTKENVDKQRGRGTFDGSIEALLRLNRLGYGRDGSDLLLNLVYNPVGASLPGSQASLERDYKRRLREDFGIEFHHLFTITNMPIKRFRRQLKRWKKLESYQELLEENFNAAAAEQVMCRDLVSIGWEGGIYDCDFNQMLELPISNAALTIWDIEGFSELSRRPIAFGDHCFGCTAGSGSSCGGSLTEEAHESAAA